MSHRFCEIESVLGDMGKSLHEVLQQRAGDAQLCHRRLEPWEFSLFAEAQGQKVLILRAFGIEAAKLG